MLTKLLSIFILLFFELNEALLFGKSRLPFQSASSAQGAPPSPLAIITTQAPKVDMNKIQKQLFEFNSIDDLKSLGIRVQEVSSLKTGKIVGGRNLFLNFDQQSDQALEGEEIKEATAGRCDPKPVCITNPLDLQVNPANQIAFPPCINIHNCGGCCSHNEECEALQTDDVKLKNVGIIEILDNNQKIFLERIISVTNHTSCECRCKFKTDEDCQRINSNFVRDDTKCDCKCPHTLNCSPFHEFDRTHCKCVCNQLRFGNLMKNCRAITNYNWNENTCRCEANRKQ